MSNDTDAHLLRELWRDAEVEVRTLEAHRHRLAASLEDARSENARLRQKLLNLGYTPAELESIASGSSTRRPA